MTYLSDAWILLLTLAPVNDQQQRGNVSNPFDDVFKNVAKVLQSVQFHLNNL